MSENASQNKPEIFTKVLRAGRRTYFFDVRATKAGDFYLTITESKKQESQGGDTYYKKHKIYLYKEDFDRFKDMMEETMNFIISEKGEELISERHNPDFNLDESESNAQNETLSKPQNRNGFSNLSFDDI